MAPLEYRGFLIIPQTDGRVGIINTRLSFLEQKHPPTVSNVEAARIAIDLWFEMYWN